MATANETKFVLTAEDKTSPALQSITRGLQGMESQAMFASRALGAIGVTASAAAMVAMVKGTIDAADGFNDLSQQVGISVRQLAGYTLAANQSGTSMESVAKGVKGLSTYMAEYGDRLRAAGITATDADGALLQLADLFAAMPDGLQKTALAVQIFGKAGMDMIPMLNMGSKGLAEAQEKADAYGKKMAELAPDADRLNDQLEEMKFQLQLVGVEMAANVAGPMAGWMEANNEAIRIAGGATEAMRLFVFSLDAMTMEKPREEISRLTKEVEKFKKEMESELRAPFIDKKLIADHEKKIDFLKFLERQEAMAGAAKLGDYRDARDLSLTTGSTMARAKGLMDKSTPKVSKGTRGIIGPDDVLDNIQEAVAKQNRAGFDERDNEVKKEIAAQEKLRQKYVEMADPLQKYRLELDEINKLRDAGLLTSAQATEAEWQVNEAMDGTVKRMFGIKEAGEDAFAGLTRVVESWGNKAADTFADFVVDGKASFSDLINSMLKDIVRLQAKNILDKPTKDAGDWLGGFLKNGVNSWFSGGYGDTAGVAAGVPRFASGGDFGGGFRMVGENGPEIEATGAARIFNASQTRDILGGAGGAPQSIRVEVVNPPGRPASVGSVQPRLDPKGMVISIILQDVKNGGAIAGEFEQVYGLNRAAGAF